MDSFWSFTSKYTDFAYEVWYSILKLQIKYGKKMFKEIQTGILLTSFSDSYFQRLVAIPLVKFHKI